MHSTHQDIWRCCTISLFEKQLAVALMDVSSVPAMVTQFCRKASKCFGTCERKMADSSSLFYSIFLYISHWNINSEKQSLEQRQKCRIPLSRLPVPITGIETILFSLDLSQSFDSWIGCSLLLTSITWRGKMKIKQSSIYGLFLRHAKCWTAHKMKKGPNAGLLG